MEYLKIFVLAAVIVGESAGCWGVAGAELCVAEGRLTRAVCCRGYR